VCGKLNFFHVTKQIKEGKSQAILPQNVLGFRQMVDYFNRERNFILNHRKLSGHLNLFFKLRYPQGLLDPKRDARFVF
jgi:hypothetical protein